MKNKNRIVLILVSLFLNCFLVSCSTDDDQASENNTNENESFANYSISGEVNTSVTSGTASFLYQKVDIPENDISIYIITIRLKEESGNHEVSLMTNLENEDPINITTGSYSIGTLGQTIAGDTDFYVSYIANEIGGLLLPEVVTGQLNITNLSPNFVEGNFEINMFGATLIQSDISIDITNGNYKATYQEVNF